MTDSGRFWRSSARVYDGHISEAWGTGKHLKWEGRLGFLAAVTPTIDRHHGVMSVLGPRFLLYRPRQANRQDVARRAIENSTPQTATIPEELRADIARFLDQLPVVEPGLPESHKDTLVRLADFGTRARTEVDRDKSTREVLYQPQPEMPPRFARQIVSLALPQRPSSDQKPLTH